MGGDGVKGLEVPRAQVQAMSVDKNGDFLRCGKQTSALTVRNWGSLNHMAPSYLLQNRFCVVSSPYLRDLIFLLGLTLGWKYS